MDIDAYANIIHEEMGYTHEEARSYLLEKNLDNMMKIELNDEPIGFINFTHENGNYYINDLDLIEKHRRKGYGSQLVKAFEKQVKELGGKKVWLHVNINNKLAILFYEKNKYDIGKRIDDYYAEGYHAFVVEKVLRSD